MARVDAFSEPAGGSPEPDPSSAGSERALSDPATVIADMTLEEKASLLTGDSAWTTPALPRLGIPAIRMADGPHGVRRTQRTESMAFAASAATCFPTASCSAATWDRELLRDMGRALGREAIALGVDVVLGPGVNMKRSPLCGRNFEYFSEDPYLAGELAIGWIDGIQEVGVGASLKHFAVNNQETRRMSVSAEVDERTLRELYLPAFEAAVTTASPWTVMCSYNRINGTYASEHRELLTDVLRDEWGFAGFVVSDWAAVHDRPAAVAAGLDLEMPGPRPRRVQAVVDAVRDGRLDSAEVDQAVLRILQVIRKSTETAKGGSFDAAEHHALARHIAADGMVLLKNEEILPLTSTGRIAVIGQAAQTPRIQGGGSSQTTPTSVDIPLHEIERAAGEADVTFAAGYDEAGASRLDLIAEAVERAHEADVAVLFITLPLSKEFEGADRTDLDLTPQQVALITAVAQAQPRTVVVLSSGSAVVMSDWIDRVPAVLQAWYAGQAAGGAIADILFGAVNPSGKLAETFPVRLEDTPAYLNFPGEGDTVRYGEGMFIGYRWYDARRTPVLFPFGHGLSYTTFAYANGRASASTIDESRGTSVQVDVTNTGSRAGSEVVQVYVRDPEASVPRPEKELRGFDKVHLEPGETKTVAIELDARAFAYWDQRLRSWTVEPGQFEVLIGGSASDIRERLSVTAVTPDRLTSTLNEMSPLRDWLTNEESRAPTIGLLHELAPIIGGVFGEAADDPDALDPHFHAYFGTMPIRGVLEFAAPAGGPDPDTRMAELAGEVGIVG